jgi:hypothetical protein
MHDMVQIALVTALFFVGCSVLCMIGVTLDAWGQAHVASKSQGDDRAEAPLPSAWRGRRRGRGHLRDGAPQHTRNQ